MNRESYADFKVGDTVYCLAWIGAPFEIAAKNDERGIISLQAPAGSSRYGAQVDIFRDTLWMLTHEKWDQIWFWPDRAGERYETVFDRFMANHKVDEVVAGYFLPGGLGGLYVEESPSRAMMFRIRGLDQGNRQVRVHPVAALADDGKSLLSEPRPDIPPDRWMRAGATVPLRLEMRMYRWCLSFGELVLNWRDFLPNRES
jgi:hypothetical protein